MPVAVVQKDEPAAAHRRSRAATALFYSGDGIRVWEILRHHRYPQDRTYLIHDMPLLKVDPTAAVDRLTTKGGESDTEADEQERRALILTLGGYTEVELGVAAKKAVIDVLLNEYDKSPDPGIHSAIAWTLKRWGRGCKPIEIK